MTQVPSESQAEMGAPCYFRDVIDIPDHLVFQTRKFNSAIDFYIACGQSRENVLVATSDIQTLVGHNAGNPLRLDVVASGFSGNPAPLLSFTLYIFARFVN